MLDTNVLVSAILTDGAARSLLRRCITGRHALLASPETLQEFVEVLKRPKFHLAEEDVHRVLAALVQTSIIVEPQRTIRVVKTDPDDDMFLELAVEGSADLIVSGDRHLLDLGEFGGIRILGIAAARKALKG